MKLLTSILFSAIVTAQDQLHQFKFVQFIAEHNKSYSTIEEFNLRFGRWTETEKFIQKNNISGATQTAGHNQFSDWTSDEYSKILTLRTDTETRDKKVFKAFN
jgi:hypothetical protein